MTMTLNLVTVAMTSVNSPADTTVTEGHYCFVPSGLQWPSTDGMSAVVPSIVQGPFSTSFSVQLVASDNFTTGVLTWNVLINIRGIPTINVPDVPIYFTDGANQNIYTILTANVGWTPVQT